MNLTFKRVLSLLLAMVMVCTMLPAGALAQEEAHNATASSSPFDQKIITYQTEVQYNPLYEGLVDKSSLPVPGGDSQSGIAATEDIVYVDEAGAVEQLRAGMVARQASVSVSFTTDDSDCETLVYQFFQDAFVHSGNPKEGDYLAWHFASWKGAVSGYVQSGVYYYTFTYDVVYYTDADQEAQMDAAVDALLAELNVGSASEYEKVKAVYDYICANVTYDHANLNIDDYTLKYTAYAALINGTSVCQGYASLLYRLCLELGVDCRVIAGYAGTEDHGWNIVKIGELYYNADSTWDAGSTSYSWFLVSDANFPNHTRADMNGLDYTSEAFCAAYPISSVNYDPDTTETPEPEDGVAIDETNFPDSVFRAYVAENFDVDGSGTLSKAEIAAVTDIDVTGSFSENEIYGVVAEGEIESLQGIGYFTELESLCCNYNQLTELDVSSNAKLSVLECCFNQLTELDVSKNAELTELCCEANQLTELDVSNNTALTSLICYGNELAELNVSNNAALTSLHCFGNQLTELDISSNAALTELRCESNELTALDVSKNTALTELTCTSNQLTALDVSKNTSLTALLCGDNQLTTLDITGNSALTVLYCEFNQLTELDVSCNSALEILICAYNRISNLDVSNCLELGAEFRCGGNAFTLPVKAGEAFDLSTLPGSFDVSKASDWVGGTVSGTILTVDAGATEVTYTYDCGYGYSETFTLIPEAAEPHVHSYTEEVTEPTCTEQGYTTHTCSCGDSYADDYVDALGHDEVTHEAKEPTCTEIGWDAYVTCSRCGYSSYEEKSALGHDIVNHEAKAATCTESGWAAYVTCTRCDHTTYTEQPALGHDFVDGSCSRCGDLEISANTFPGAYFRDYVTENFDTDGNGTLSAAEINAVTTINVSGYEARNNLKGIEFFTALTKLICYQNDLTSLDVSKNTALTYLNCSSNELTELNVGSNTALTYLDCRANALTELDLSRNTALETLDCRYNQLTALDMSRNAALVKVQCSENLLTSLNVSGCTALEILECYSNKLTSLDISTNTALKDLDCRLNQLTQLDVSSNAALEDLRCSTNQLTRLDVSQNMALKTLRCSANQLTSLDCSGHPALRVVDAANNQLTNLNVKNCGALESLFCESNWLSSLDVSTNTALTGLYCESNQLTRLDVSQNTVLDSLECQNNQLTQLDVSQNTALLQLYCASNQLTSLDVSQNTALTHLVCNDNQLTNLDISNTAVTYLDFSSNQFTVNLSSNTLDLTTLPGSFDADKASGWIGGSVIGNVLTVNSGVKQVTYLYDCGKGTSETFTLNISDHIHSYTEVVTAPTCTEDGYTTYTCSCGHSYAGDYVEALGHDTVEHAGKAPTCTGKGWDAYVTCNRCEYSTFAEKAALGHDIVSYEAKAPTCTEIGWDAYETCSRCDHSTYAEKAALGHDIVNHEAKAPTCTEIGWDAYEACSRCEHSTYAEKAALGHDYENGVCTRCGEADSGYVPSKPTLDGVIRIAGTDRIETSLRLANQLKAILGIEAFDTIVVASGMNFPDALTGSYLAAVKNAPILLTNGKADSKVLSYIRENLGANGTVYILGGENSVSKDLESQLAVQELHTKRLAGSNRYETNLAILEEAGVNGDQEVLICTSQGFADSLSASAAGLPILLVHDSLTKAQKAFLETTSGRFTIVGGTASVSEKLEQELKALGTVNRLAGSSRYETSVMMAEAFIENPSSVVLAYARNYPDGLCGGPLAYVLGAPLILADDSGYQAADSYVTGITSGIVAGGTTLFPDSLARTIFDLPSDTLIPSK